MKAKVKRDGSIVDVFYHCTDGGGTWYREYDPMCPNWDKLYRETELEFMED